MKQLSSAPQLFVKTSIAAAIAFATAAATPAFAQLEEVIVTAQKRSQTVQDVPSSVAAFSEEMLDKSNTRNFGDLGKLAAGMTLTPSGDGFGSIIKIRGVGNNAFAPAIRPSVGIFLDDIPLGATEAAYNNMADIERIEVLKGPQATLFGKEVSAGAISLYTKRPDTEAMDAYVEGNFGNNELVEFRVGGNLPIADSFAVRASVYKNDRGNIRDNLSSNAAGVKQRDGGELDALGFRLRGLWEPTDTFSATLGYENHETDVDGTTSIAQQYGDLYAAWETEVVGITDPADTQLNVLDPYGGKTAVAAPLARNTETTIWSLNMVWDFGENWTMTSVTSDQEYLLLTTGHDGTGYVNSDGDTVPDSPGTSVGPYKFTAFVQESGTDSFTQELRFNYEGDSWSSIVGAFYAETDVLSIVDFNQTSGIFAGGLAIQAPGISDLSDDTTEWAIFNHNIWSIREGLDLTFGVRYSEVEKVGVKGQTTGTGLFKDFIHPLVPKDTWSDDIPVQKDDWDEITGTVKLTWWLNDEISVYGGWDRGFKAGGHNVCKGTSGDVDTPNCPEPFESETADNFEIGLKGRFLDSTFVWNIAAFYQTYDDYQVDVQDDEGIGNSVKNAAKVKIEGFETDFQWLATEKLLLDGNLAYVDATWDEFTNADCLRPQYQAVACSEDANGNFTQDLSGERLNYTSPWTANLNATWSDQLNNGLNWYIRGEISYRDDVFFFPDLDPALTADSYSVFNGSIGFSGEGGNWDVILWGKNLLDEEYLDNGSRNRDATAPRLAGFTGATPVEGYRVSPGAEPTYGVTLKYRFGDF